MIILAFDTCFAAIEAAVLRDGIVLAHVTESVTSGHGERLMPVIEQALAQAGVVFTDLDRIAVTLGPGGFTGLRVGVAVARALALATGLPIVGMTTLELLARTAVARGDVTLQDGAVLVATADARKGALYVQRFAADFRALDQPTLVEAMDDALANDSESTVAIGAGADRLAAASDGRIRAAAQAILPDARVLARAARDLTCLAEPRPLYVRAADAKPQTGKSLPRA